MLNPLESNFLAPTGAFVVPAVAALAVFGLLVVWPFFETALRRQWGYMLGVVLLGPIGGLLWFFVGRRETSHKSQNHDTPRPRVPHSI